jgi:hypothetical protein
MNLSNPSDPKVDRWLRKQAPRVATIIAAGLMLAGCSSPFIVQNPRTGETVVCEEGAYELNPWSQHDACVADHVAQGWTVTSAP